MRASERPLALYVAQCIEFAIAHKHSLHTPKSIDRARRIYQSAHTQHFVEERRAQRYKMHEWHSFLFIECTRTAKIYDANKIQSEPIVKELHE